MNELIIIFAAYLIYIAALYSALYVFWKHDKKYFLRDFVFLLGTALISWGIAHILKDVIAHPRPDVEALIIPDDKFSFPSGHASFMFALAFAMNLFNLRSGLILVVLALITGTARVLAGVHFWYDIIAGAILGYIVATIATILYTKFVIKK